MVITSVDVKIGEFTYSKSSIMEISGNDPKSYAFNIEFAKQIADWNEPIN